MNSFFRKISVTAAVLGSLALAGCVEDDNQIEQIRTQYVAIVPPDTLYECPKRPDKPPVDAQGHMKDSQVAVYLVKINEAHRVCSKSLHAIKAFADQAKLKVESANN